MSSSLSDQNSKLPSTLNPLPLSVIPLDQWQLVTVTGADSVSYLQGQISCDVEQLARDNYSYCAHCDAKGKLWSSLCLFHLGEGLAYLLRRSVSEIQLRELKKYALFSKVAIELSTQWKLLAVAGEGSREALQRHFARLPDEQTRVVHDGEHHCTLLYFNQPQARFLLVITEQQQQQLLMQLQQAGAVMQGDVQWLALEIAAGIPVIDEASSHCFIPQAVNLQQLEGISFDKGCYLGQETIARAKYRGINKRALYWLSGYAQRVPQPAEELELALGSEWRRSGHVLAACQTEQGELWVQAVLSHDLDAADRLRIREDGSSQLTMMSLPYPRDKAE